MKKSIYIYGIHPVLDTLRASPESFKKIWIKKSASQKQVREIVTIASRRKIVVEVVEGENVFRERIRDSIHQGVMAEINSPKMQTLEELISSLDKSKNPSLVILDELNDSHNIGAIIRSAVAFGVSGVLIPKNNQAGITGTVFKTSAGTINNIPIVEIGNINQTIRKLKDNGFWIYGLSEKGSTSLSQISFDSPSVFVIGNEHSGIAQKTQELCDVFVNIPMQAGIDSLNVSVSTAILFWEWQSSLKL